METAAMDSFPTAQEYKSDKSAQGAPAPPVSSGSSNPKAKSASQGKSVKEEEKGGVVNSVQCPLNEQQLQEFERSCGWSYERAEELRQTLHANFGVSLRDPSKAPLHIKKWQFMSIAKLLEQHGVPFGKRDSKMIAKLDARRHLGSIVGEPTGAGKTIITVVTRQIIDTMIDESLRFQHGSLEAAARKFPDETGITLIVTPSSTLWEQWRQHLVALCHGLEPNQILMYNTKARDEIKKRLADDEELLKEPNPMAAYLRKRKYRFIIASGVTVKDALVEFKAQCGQEESAKYKKKLRVRSATSKAAIQESKMLAEMSDVQKQSTKLNPLFGGVWKGTVTRVWFRCIVVDEMHKHRRFKTGNALDALCQLRAWTRWGLTAKLFQNNIQEWVDSLRCVYVDAQPGLLNKQEWKRKSDDEVSALCKQMLIRSTDADKLGLPPFTHTTPKVPLSELEQQLYDQAAGEAVAEYDWLETLDADDRSNFFQNILVWIATLRAMTNDVRLPCAEFKKKHCTRCQRKHGAYYNSKEETGEQVVLKPGTDPKCRALGHRLCKYCNNDEVKCKVCLMAGFREQFEEHGAGGRALHSSKTHAVVADIRKGLQSNPNNKAIVFSEWRSYLLKFLKPALHEAFPSMQLSNTVPKALLKKLVHDGEDDSDDDEEEKVAAEKPEKSDQQREPKRRKLESGKAAERSHDSDDSDNEMEVKEPAQQEPRMGQVAAAAADANAAAAVQEPDIRVVAAKAPAITLFLYMGGMSTVQRNKVQSGFLACKGPAVLLITSKAGGVGLNLAGHNIQTMINCEKPYNPASEEQQLGRIRRIGQKQPVTAVTLITNTSIDEGVVQLCARKHALGEFLVNQKTVKNRELDAVQSDNKPPKGPKGRKLGKRRRENANSSGEEDEEEDDQVLQDSALVEPMAEDEFEEIKANNSANNTGRKARPSASASGGPNKIAAFDSLDTVFKPIIKGAKEAAKRAREQRSADGRSSSPLFDMES